MVIVGEIRETIEAEKIDFKFKFITGFQTGKLKLEKPDFLVGLPDDTIIYIVPGGSEEIDDTFYNIQEIGTGLGLSMVHGIVKGHNGAISISSTPFKSTRFTVLIPRMEQAGDEDSPAEELVCRGGQGMILFVEDDEEQRETVPRTIEKLGYQVAVAAGAEDAINLVESDPDNFDLVITDYDMPKTSGLDLAKHLGRRFPGLPVILVSGRNVEFSRKESANIKLFIVKPYNQNDLARGIQNALYAPERGITRIPHGPDTDH